MIVVMGRNKFYRLTQSDNPLITKLPSYFCMGHIQRLVHDFEVQREGRNKDRISEAALALYSDDSLAGYGDYEFKKTDGKPLLEQQRGLIIPLVIEEIENYIAKCQSMPRVLEVGVANGDVLAYLAEKYPDIEFVGIDLSIANAERKYQVSNMRFVKGYSLDMFAESPETMKADIVFGTSTFMAMVPNEFRKHVEEFAKTGTTSIVISDPVTEGMKHKNDIADKSLHMSQYMWWHNHAGYMRKVGFSISHWEQRTFPYLSNPNAQVILVTGRMS